MTAATVRLMSRRSRAGVSPALTSAILVLPSWFDELNTLLASLARPTDR
jgi:hypothetical protein